MALTDVFTRARSTQVHAWIETDDGYEVELRATVYPGSPEVPPGFDHGGIPADGPELDQVEAHVGGRWVDLDDVAWLDRAQCEDLIWEAACDAARD